MVNSAWKSFYELKKPSGIILLLLFHCNWLMIRKNIFVTATLNVKGFFPIMKFMSLFFSSPEPLGSLVSLQYSHGPSSVRPSSTIVKDLLKNRFAYQSQISNGASVGWGEQKFVRGGLGHMTKMAATPIFGKNLSKVFFSRTKGPMTLWLGM